ncbi:MAG: exosortase/archaeosortase family protein [Planctomycetes bacterium]|nr:exosortase/archaeosortase family protein [Planctomycetota bacterium]
MKPKAIVISLAIVAILSLFYWPTFRWLVNSWTGESWFSNDSSNYYSHGFLVPLVSGFFIWLKRDYLKERTPSIIGPFVLAFGALIYIVGFALDMRVLGGLSLIIVIAALFLLIFGTRATRAMVFPIAFLLFMVPPPFIQELGYDLQDISAHSSAWLLETLGLPITSAIPEIYLGDTTFTIGLPCSGTNTLVALLALSAVYIFMLSGSSYRKLSLFVLAVPIAILANILRITSIIMVAHYHEVETATGWYHDLSSPLFFFTAFLFLILLSRIVKCKLNYDILRN